MHERCANERGHFCLLQVRVPRDEFFQQAPNIPPVLRRFIATAVCFVADVGDGLARYFGGDARSWLNLQAAYDLRVAEIASGKRIAKEISPAAA